MAARAFAPHGRQAIASLSREDRIALQKKIAGLGYKVRDFQGRIDFDLRDAIRIEQKKLGLHPDGHPTAELLTRLGQSGR